MSSIASRDSSSSCRFVLPLSSCRDVAPGETMVVDVRSNSAEFPYMVCFGQGTLGCFEVDEVSLRSARRLTGRPGGHGRTPHVLRSRGRGDRTDLASVGELLCRVVLPAYVDLALVVRNVGSVPQRFLGACLSHGSVVDQREELLRNCSGDGIPLDYARIWWGEDHQRIAGMLEAEARRIDAELMLCADGSPRQDLRVVFGQR